MKLPPSEPVYAQIAQRLRDQIMSGVLTAGTELPTVRAHALKLGVNVNTIQRAYAILREGGLIGGRSSQGSVVLGVARPADAQAERRAELNLRVSRFIGEQTRHGYTLDEIEAAFFGQRERLTTPQRAEPRKSRYFGQGSHDLSLERLLAGIPRPRIIFGTVGSLAGLAALARGEADFAASHLLDPATSDYNLPIVRELLPDRRMTLITVALRQIGWLVPAGNPRRFGDAADLTRRGMRFINRQPGAGTRILLDALLRRARVSRRRVTGYETEAVTHLDVAQAVAEGRADVGLGIASAASACGLGFVPVTRERFELVVPAESALVGIFRQALEREDIRSAMGALGGYDLSETGHCRETA